MTRRDSGFTMQWRLAGGLPDTLRETLARLDGMRLAAADRSRLAIIVEELLANLFEHGMHRPESEGVIEVRRSGDHVEIAVEDSAAPFDPRRSVNAPAPERGGGAGIALVRVWAESLDYRAGPPNRLELRYRLAGPD